MYVPVAFQSDEETATPISCHSFFRVLPHISPETQKEKDKSFSSEIQFTSSFGYFFGVVLVVVVHEFLLT